MPNQHAPDKICVSAWVPRTVHLRLVKASKRGGMSVTEYVEHLYNNATKEIELTPEDYRKIALATEQATTRGADRRRRLGLNRNPRPKGAAQKASH